jgi:hypothetical protein
MINGEPWFVARDVVQALGLSIKNTTNHIAKLGRSNVLVVKRGDSPNPLNPVNALLTDRVPSLTLVSEPGLYALIQRSDKPEARVFQDWVNGTVLPAIRKTGGYLLNEAARETAHADTREAMPLPMDIAEAVATAVAKAIEPLLKEVLALQRTQTAAFVQREEQGLDELKRNQMFTARDLLKRGIGKGRAARAAKFFQPMRRPSLGDAQGEPIGRTRETLDPCG